jgi:hypothetical protein
MEVGTLLRCFRLLMLCMSVTCRPEMCVDFLEVGECSNVLDSGVMLYTSDVAD